MLDNSCLLSALGIRTQIDLTYVQIPVPEGERVAALFKLKEGRALNDEERLALESVDDISLDKSLS